VRKRKEVESCVCWENWDVVGGLDVQNAAIAGKFRGRIFGVDFANMRRLCAGPVAGLKIDRVRVGCMTTFGWCGYVGGST